MIYTSNAGTIPSEISSVSIGRRIASFRRERHMTQLNLAVAAGITRDQISRIELGKSIPKLETIERIETALGLPRWTILNDPDKKKKKNSNRNEVYNRIIRELEKRDLTQSELLIIESAAISIADTLKNKN